MSCFLLSISALRGECLVSYSSISALRDECSVSYLSILALRAELHMKKKNFGASRQFFLPSAFESTVHTSEVLLDLVLILRYKCLLWALGISNYPKK